MRAQCCPAAPLVRSRLRETLEACVFAEKGVPVETVVATLAQLGWGPQRGPTKPHDTLPRGGCCSCRVLMWQKDRCCRQSRLWNRLTQEKVWGIAGSERFSPPCQSRW